LYKLNYIFLSVNAVHISNPSIDGAEW